MAILVVLASGVSLAPLSTFAQLTPQTGGTTNGLTIKGNGNTVYYNAAPAANSKIEYDKDGKPVAVKNDGNKINETEDTGYVVTTTQVAMVPAGLQQVSTTAVLNQGDMRGQQVFSDGNGRYFVSQGTGCKQLISSSCFELKITDKDGNNALTKEVTSLEGAIAKANKSTRGGIDRPIVSKPGGNCEPNIGLSQGGMTVENCDNGTQRITYANGAVEVREVDAEGRALKMGSLTGFDAAGARDDGYSWKGAAAYQGQNAEDPCKTSKTIDGERFGCTGSDTMVAGGKLLMAGSDVVGSTRIQQQGMATWQQVQAAGGAPSDVYNGQADMYENAGKTQKKIGTVNLVAGMAQMLASQKALRAKGDLQKEKDALSTKLKAHRGADGTILADDGTGATNGKDANGKMHIEDGFVGADADKVTYRRDGLFGKKIKEDITERVVSNFELNNSFKLNTSTEARQGQDLKSAGNAATLMREKELALKEKKVRGDATQILQSAIQEQTEAAGRVLKGGIESAVGGLTQRMTGSSNIQTAKSFRALADTMKTQDSNVPTLDLTHDTDGSTVTARTGGAITGSPTAPVTSGAEADTTTTAGAPPLGTPLNTQPVQNNAPPGWYGGGYSAHDPLANSGGGGGGGGGGGPNAQLGGLTQGAATAQNPFLVPPPGVDKHTEFKELRGYDSPGGAAAVAGAGGGGDGLGDLVKSLLREDGSGKKIEDGRDLAFGGRSPASDGGGPILDSSTDLFKQISAAYRGKSEQGAVGFASGRQ